MAGRGGRGQTAVLQLLSRRTGPEPSVVERSLRGRPLSGVGLQQPLDEVLRSRRHVLPGRLCKQVHVHSSLDDLVVQIKGPVVVKRQSSTQTDVAQNPDAPDVDLGPVLLLSDQLWRQVEIRATERLGACHPVGRVSRNAASLCQPKVGDLAAKELVNQDVLGLEVSVDDSVPVDEPEGIQQVDHDLLHDPLLHGTVREYILVQVPTAAQLQNHSNLVLVLVNVLDVAVNDAHYVWMIPQELHDLDLLDYPADGHLVRAVDDLHGVRVVGGLFAAVKDLRKLPRPDYPTNPVLLVEAAAANILCDVQTRPETLLDCTLDCRRVVSHPR